MKSSVDVHRFLLEKGVPHEIVPVDVATRTCETAATELGLAAREIAKCVFFEADQHPVQVIISGDRKVNYDRLERALGTEEARLASPEQVLDWTSYPLGATPPVAIEEHCRTLVDKGLLDKDVVYTGAGGLNSILKLKVQDLIKLTGAEVVDVSS